LFLPVPSDAGFSSRGCEFRLLCTSWEGYCLVHCTWMCFARKGGEELLCGLLAFWGTVFGLRGWEEGVSLVVREMFPLYYSRIPITLAAENYCKFTFDTVWEVSALLKRGFLVSSLCRGGDEFLEMLLVVGEEYPQGKMAQSRVNFELHYIRII
jgi:hypothetical protein